MARTLPSTRRTTGMSAVLRVPGMPVVLTAHAVSMAGTLAAEVALSILIFQRTGSAFLSALVLVCSFLPYAVGGTLLSSLADRFPPRRLLVCCDLLSAACIAAMLVPGLPVLALLGLLLVTGFVAPLFQGARAASLSHLLDADLFPVGRSLLRTISQTAVVSGFALGSVLVAAVGPLWLLASDAASFLLSAALIGWGTRATPAADPDGERTLRTVVRASADGLRHLCGNPPLRRLILLTWAVPGFSAVGDGLAVAYTAQAHAPVSTAGVLFTGYAVGTVLGELLVARLRPETRGRLVLPLVLLSQLPFLVFVFAPALPLAGALLLLSGAGFACNQGIDPLILRESEPALRGRLFTVQTSGLMTVQGVVIAVSGALGSHARPGLVIAAFGALGACTVLWLALHSPVTE
ncbi:MFS transporter [Streptomyces sp. NBC_00932]|uniref:MFS transporter n=1 Tax=Streptomyces sp. NBC_00932 TaxID=2903690 RepID=UPI003867A44F|nr:MFS transporter [Streptomyces sp. NBC_00932]